MAEEIYKRKFLRGLCLPGRSETKTGGLKILMGFMTAFPKGLWEREGEFAYFFIRNPSKMPARD